MASCWLNDRDIGIYTHYDPYGQGRSPWASQREVGSDRDLIEESNLRHKDVMTTLEVCIADIGPFNINRAVTERLDQSQALEASFKAIATLRGLTLMNFM